MDAQPDPGGPSNFTGSYFPPQAQNVRPSTSSSTASGYNHHPPPSPPSSTSRSKKKRSPSSTHSRSSTSPQASGGGGSGDPKARRRERNRLAASAFRTRKKEKLEVLEGRLGALEEENQGLKAEVGRLRDVIHSLGGGQPIGSDLQQAGLVSGGEMDTSGDPSANHQHQHTQNDYDDDNQANGWGQVPDADPEPSSSLSAQSQAQPQLPPPPITHVQSASPPLLPPPNSIHTNIDPPPVPSNSLSAEQNPFDAVPQPLLPSNTQAQHPAPVQPMTNLPIHLRRLPSSSSLSRLPMGSPKGGNTLPSMPSPLPASPSNSSSLPFSLSLSSLPAPTTPSLLSASAGGFTPGGSRYSFHPSSPFAMGLAVSDVRSTPSPGGMGMMSGGGGGYGWGGGRG